MISKCCGADIERQGMEGYCAKCNKVIGTYCACNQSPCSHTKSKQTEEISDKDIRKAVECLEKAEKLTPNEVWEKWAVTTLMVWERNIRFNERNRILDLVEKTKKDYENCYDVEIALSDLKQEILWKRKNKTLSWFLLRTVAKNMNAASTVTGLLCEKVNPK